MVQKKLQDKYLIEPGASVSLFQFESLDDDKEGWPNIEIHFERTLTSRWCLTLERSNKKVQKDIYLCIILSAMSYWGRCVLQKRLSFSSQYIICHQDCPTWNVSSTSPLASSVHCNFLSPPNRLRHDRLTFGVSAKLRLGGSSCTISTRRGSLLLWMDEKLWQILMQKSASLESNLVSRKNYHF